MYVIVFSLNFLTAERHLILGTAKINQHIRFKVFLTSKLGSNDMLLWKRGSSLVSTEDENLWIHSRLIWFVRAQSPERSP